MEVAMSTPHRIVCPATPAWARLDVDLREAQELRSVMALGA